MRIRHHLKPHKCEVCGAGFDSVKDVCKHQKVAHVLTGAYKCYNCSCQFESRRSLERHMRRRHPLHSAEESRTR
jgi:hypothetical protein